MNHNRTRTIVITILAALGIGLAAWVSWLVYTTPVAKKMQPTQPAPTITDFQSCITAGNPVTQTSPRQCMANGVTYTEQMPIEQPTTKEFTSPKGVTVRLHDWTTNKSLSSPATITGEIPGNWSFEASFPVTLIDANGSTLAQQPAHLQGDWMTTSYVPFTTIVTFATPQTSKNGTLILQKDNPSGLPQNDDEIKIPVTLQ